MEDRSKLGQSHSGFGMLDRHFLQRCACCHFGITAHSLALLIELALCSVCLWLLAAGIKSRPAYEPIYESTSLWMRWKK